MFIRERATSVYVNVALDKLDVHAQVLSRDMSPSLAKEYSNMVYQACSLQEKSRAVEITLVHDPEIWQTHEIGPPVARERGY